MLVSRDSATSPLRVSTPHLGLELLLEGAHLEFYRPRAAMLMGQVPVGLRDRVGIEHVFTGIVADLAPGNVDGAVDVDPRHVDALGTEVARERLRQPAHRELRRPERDRLGPGLHSRGRTGEEHYA